MRQPETATFDDASVPRRRNSGVQLIRRPPEGGTTGFQHSVRVDPNGQVIAGRGKYAELGALTAYLGRLGDLVGECMGIGAMTAAEVASSTDAYLFYRDGEGCSVGLVPRRTTNVRALRARLGL